MTCACLWCSLCLYTCWCTKVLQCNSSNRHRYIAAMFHVCEWSRCYREKEWIYVQCTPWWIGAWVGKNIVISVLQLQCLPTNPKIATNITCNPHNLFLPAKILHQLHNRQRQGNTISSSGGGHPNVSVFPLLTCVVVLRNEKFSSVLKLIQRS